jgi:hypothetical protein
LHNYPAATDRNRLCWLNRSSGWYIAGLNQEQKGGTVFNLLLFSLSAVQNTNTVDIFYKQMPPSLQVLERVDSVLAEFKDDYTIAYHVITDPASGEIIQRYNLPETHFPFAIVVNGKYTASMDEELVHFVHFPLFMEGIGRHEGNWSMETLRLVLEDNSLLNKQNSLPVLNQSDETSECQGEE